MDIKISNAISQIEQDYNVNVKETNNMSNDFYLKVIDISKNCELDKVVVSTENLGHAINNMAERYGVDIKPSTHNTLLTLGYERVSDSYYFVLERDITPSRSRSDDGYYLVTSNRRKDQLIEDYFIKDSVNLDMNITSILNSIEYIYPTYTRVQSKMVRMVLKDLLSKGVCNWGAFSILLLTKEEYTAFKSSCVDKDIPGFVSLIVEEKINTFGIRYKIPLNINTRSLLEMYLTDKDIYLSNSELENLIYNERLDTDKSYLRFNVCSTNGKVDSDSIIREINNVSSNSNYTTDVITSIEQYLNTKDIRTLSRVYTAIVFDNESSEKDEIIRDVAELVKAGKLARPYGGIINGVKETIAIIMADYLGGE